MVTLLIVSTAMAEVLVRYYRGLPGENVVQTFGAEVDVLDLVGR
jgi:hypothetical protein